VSPLGGADRVTLGDLAGTGIGQVALDLGSSAGGPADGQVDAVTLNGSGGADNLAVTSGPSGIAVAGLAVSNSITAFDASDELRVNGLAGADALNASGLAANAVALTLGGGPDADTLTGSPGDDAFASDPGDVGTDVVEGAAGADRLAIDGSDAADNMAFAAVGARVLFTRDGGATDANDVESADVSPGRGADVVNVGNLAGTDLTDVGADFASPEGSGDGQADNLIVNGTNGDDVITVTGGPSGVSVGGLAAAATVTGSEAGIDTLTIPSLGGADVVDASGLEANRIGLTLQGGLGADVFIGSQGNDLVQGGDGNDVALLGAGDDTFVWNPGDDNDTIEGQAGSDRLLFNGSNASENIDISPNGGRMRFFRDVANVTMDADDVETVDFNALGGIDAITVNNLAGTDVTQVNLALAAAGGGGDAAADNVNLVGTNGDDVVTISGGPAGVNAIGLVTGLAITGAEAANDRLTVSALAGNDVVDASAVAAGAALLTLNGDANDDVLFGGAGDDTLNGGLGDDVLIGGPGIDTLNGGGQAGDILIQ
jgi:Ca2+-binding RTX toxin-like protein